MCSCQQNHSGFIALSVKRIFGEFLVEVIQEKTKIATKHGM